jgi:hypothetical protein
MLLSDVVMTYLPVNLILLTSSAIICNLYKGCILLKHRVRILTILRLENVEIKRYFCRPTLKELIIYFLVTFNDGYGEIFQQRYNNARSVCSALIVKYHSYWGILFYLITPLKIRPARRSLGQG